MRNITKCFTRLPIPSDVSLSCSATTFSSYLVIVVFKISRRSVQYGCEVKSFSETNVECAHKYALTLIVMNQIIKCLKIQPTFEDIECVTVIRMEWLFILRSAISIMDSVVRFTIKSFFLATGHDKAACDRLGTPWNILITSKTYRINW